MDSKDNLIVEDAYREAVSGLREEWFHLQDDEWLTYVMNLPERLRYVYLIEILESQVYNGGFHQYFFNKYGIFALETINALDAVKAFIKRDLLKEAYNRVNAEGLNMTDFRRSLITEKLPFFRDTTYYKSFEDLDQSYDDSYANENLLSLMAAFIQSIN